MKRWRVGRDAATTAALWEADDGPVASPCASDQFFQDAWGDQETTAWEAEAFLGGLGRQVSRSVASVTKGKLVRSIGDTIGSVSRDVEKTANKIGKAVPMLGTIAQLASHSPVGMVMRTGYGALSATLRGQDPFMGALSGLAGTPLLAGFAQLGVATLRGENLIKATKLAVKAGVSDVREAMRLAAMVAPFVPGIGTGVGAALGAANALASGQPITQALIASVRGAIPGGAIAQVAFDTAANMVQGKRIDAALLGAARNQLPPGPAQAAFDTGLALAQGKNLQTAALTGATGLLPPSPYAADAAAFARRALAGDNLSQAALSTAGNAVMRGIRAQGGDLLATVQGRVGLPAVPSGAVKVAAQVAAKPVAKGLAQVVAEANRSENHQASLFLHDLVGKGRTAPTQPGGGIFG